MAIKCVVIYTVRLFFFITTIFSTILFANDIPVLVVDGPIDFTHQDLFPYRSNFIPCDFNNRRSFTETFILDSSPFEAWEHGTHVAGIIASHVDPNNTNRVTINSGVLFPPSTQDDEVVELDQAKIEKKTKDKIKQIEDYINLTKPKVVNMSYGEDLTSFLILISFAEGTAAMEGKTKEEAIKQAIEKYNATLKFEKDLYEEMMKKFPDTLFVIAAGNDAQNLGFADGPVNFNSVRKLLRKYKKGKIGGLESLINQIHLPNTIVVGSVDADKIKRADFSNYSNKHVDIMAEGDKIMSTAPGGDYIELSGTSMAAPQVSGVAAYYLQQNPELSAAEVKQKIFEESKSYFRLRRFSSEGRMLQNPDK